MRRILEFLAPLTLITALLGCRDELPTELASRPDIRPQLALVNGPLTPINGGVVTSPVVTIDNSPGDQEAPRLSGDLACYPDFASFVVRTYRFSSGSHDVIPPPATGLGD